MQKLTTSILALFALSGAALAQDARLTVVHGVPGLPRAVDVFADGNQLFSFCFEEQRGPLLLPAGTYDVEVRLAGTTVLAQTYTLGAGDDVSVAAHLDAVGNPLLSAFVNDGSNLALPASRVAVRHTAAAPAVDVAFFVGGTEVLTIPALANGQQAAADVPPGQYEVALRVAGTSTVAFGPVPVTVDDGYRYGVFAVGEVGTPSFDLVVQRDALAAFVRSMEGLQFAGIDPHLVLDGTEVLPLDSLVEGPVAVQPGTYTAEVRIQSGQAALVTQSITLARGDDRTLLPHLGFGTLFRFGSFANSTAPLALANNARVTVRHLALAPTVDVIVTQGGAPVATIAGLSNGDEAVAELPEGTYEVAIAPAGTTTPVFGPVALNFAARTNTIAQALGSLGTTFTVGVDTIDLSGVPQPSEVLVRNEGTSCGPTLSASAQCLFFEQPFDVRVAGGPSDSAALLIWGTGPGASVLPLPLDGSNFGAPGCFLFVEPRAFELLALDGSGSGARSFRVPAAVAGFATPLYAQAIVAGTNALHLATSEALVIEPN